MAIIQNCVNVSGTCGSRMGRALAKPIVVFHEVMGFARAQPILQSQASRSAEIGRAHLGATDELAGRAGRDPATRVTRNGMVFQGVAADEAAVT